MGEEKIAREREAMANEIQEMRRTMEQNRTSRPEAADYQGNQENSSNLEPQNENPEASGAASLPVAPGASGTQNNTPQNNAANARNPNVIPITDQNRHLVRDGLGGIIILADGTLKLTQQFLTQQQNPDIQRIKKYSTRPTQTPECV